MRSRNVRCQSAEIEPLATSKNIEFQSEYESIKAFRVFTSSNKVLGLPNYWVDRRLITATSRCASTRCVKRNEFLFEFQFAILRFSHTKPSQLRGPTSSFHLPILGWRIAKQLIFIMFELFSMICFKLRPNTGCLV